MIVADINPHLVPESEVEFSMQFLGWNVLNEDPACSVWSSTCKMSLLKKDHVAYLELSGRTYRLTVPIDRYYDRVLFSPLPLPDGRWWSIVERRFVELTISLAPVRFEEGMVGMTTVARCLDGNDGELILEHSGEYTLYEWRDTGEVRLERSDAMGQVTINKVTWMRLIEKTITLDDGYVIGL